MSAGWEIKYTGLNTSEREWNDIWDILCQCDHEFVPSLSSRNSSAQTNLSGLTDPVIHTAENKEAAKPYTYFDELKHQHFILAELDGKVTGFLTFKPDYICGALQDFGLSNYITTVCVNLKYRGQGILKSLYDHMENNLPLSVKCSRITTRTWSQNDAQIHTLLKRGYELLKTLDNDRGEGIDTMYFGKVMVDG